MKLGEPFRRMVFDEGVLSGASTSLSGASTSPTAARCMPLSRMEVWALMCTEWLTMLLGCAGMVFDETRPFKRMVFDEARLYGMVFDEARPPGMMSDRRNMWHAGQALSLSKQAQACSEGAET